MARTNAVTRSKKPAGSKKASEPKKTSAKSKKTTADGFPKGLKYSNITANKRFLNGEVAYVSDKLNTVAWRKGALFPSVVKKGGFSSKNEDQSKLVLVNISKDDGTLELNIMGLWDNIIKAIDRRALDSGYSLDDKSVVEFKEKAARYAIDISNIDGEFAKEVINSYSLNRPVSEAKRSFPFTISQLNEYRKEVSEKTKEVSYTDTTKAAKKSGGVVSASKWDVRYLKPTEGGNVTRITNKWTPNSAATRSARLAEGSASSFKELAVVVDGVDYVVQAINSEKLNQFLDEVVKNDGLERVVLALKDEARRVFSQGSVFPVDENPRRSPKVSAFASPPSSSSGEERQSTHKPPPKVLDINNQSPQTFLPKAPSAFNQSSSIRTSPKPSVPKSLAPGLSPNPPKSLAPGLSPNPPKSLAPGLSPGISHTPFNSSFASGRPTQLTPAPGKPVVAPLTPNFAGSSSYRDTTDLKGMQ